MDISLISAALTSQAGGLQTQVATSVLKSSIDDEQSSVLTILGVGQQSGSSLANVADGIGGNLNVTA